MPEKERNNTPMNRKKKSKAKDVFLYVPDTEKEGFYLKMTLTKEPPKPLSEQESEVFFSKYGVARFCDESGVFLEIWMGSKRVRIGTQEDVDTFVCNFYERRGAEVPSDLTADQLILAYATTAFAKCYQMKVNPNDIAT